MARTSRLVSVLLALVPCLLVSSLSARSERKPVDGQELLARAFRALDLRAEHQGPYRLKGILSLSAMPKGAPPGEWTMAWDGPGRWRETLSLPGFERSRASGPSGLWERAEPDRSFPLVTSVTAALAPLQFLRLLPGDVITASKRVRGGAGAVRIEIDRSARHEAKVSVLVNESTGFLMAIERADVANRFEYLDRVKVGSRFFPQTIRVRRGGNVHAEVTVSSVALSSSLSDAQLTRPAMARALMTSACKRRTLPVLVRKPKPDFPADWGEEDVEGIVLLELDVDVDGRVSRVKVLRSDHWRLTEPVVAAARHRLYQAGTCDGEAVLTRVRMGVAHPEQRRARAGRKGRTEGYR